MLQKTFEIQIEKPHTHLLHIEIGVSHILFNSFNTEGTPAAGLEYYNFDASESWVSIWTDIQQQSKIVTADNHFDNIQICWENDWAQAVPTTLFQKELEKSYLPLNKGSLAGNKYLITQAEEYTFPFWVPEEIFKSLLQRFPQATHNHKYAAIVRQLSSFETTYPMQVLLIFYQDHFILCVFKGTRLQMINTHSFDGGTAIIYHLLNAIQHSGGRLDQSCVYLSGLIDGDSALYREIYKFVPVIDVDQLTGATFLTEHDSYPSHFFVPFYKYI